MAFDQTVDNAPILNLISNNNIVDVSPVEFIAAVLSVDGTEPKLDPDDLEPDHDPDPEEDELDSLNTSFVSTQDGMFVAMVMHSERLAKQRESASSM